VLADKLNRDMAARVFQAAFEVRRRQAALARWAARRRGEPTEQERRERASADELQRGRAHAGGQARRRNILFITTDQQRFDSLGVNGGAVARTPAIDRLAAEGINYRRAHVHNVVCMPSRSTMLTGQYPRTHGVIANGIALPDDAPSVARELRSQAGYRTALIGKAHFEPHLDLGLRFFENRCAAEGSEGPWRGFEHVELATHGPLGGHHYAAWMRAHHRENMAGFGGVLTGRGGGDTGAPEVSHNPVPRGCYHTDWVAERTTAWLGTISPEEPWFCWMSFPDPHHPFDPPLDEVKKRIDWRALALPAGHPGNRDAVAAILGARPRHWLDWYRGAFRNPEGGPVTFVPARLTHDQVREVNAMIHVENELIDEAIGRVMAWLVARGLDEHTDVVFTSDHGELQGDFGLMFKGPYHVEALLRVPLVWRPAPAAGVAPAVIDDPVGNVDLAPTFCAIGGIDVPAWMEGAPLPRAPGAGHERLITTFDSQFAAVGMHLRTIYRDGFLCTVYEPRTRDAGGRFPLFWAIWGSGTRVPHYDGSEGELYDCREDPHQWHNLWSDPARRKLRDELVADLRASLPPMRTPALPVASPT
jgi:arylsulfatase A-like enzyme